MSKAQSISFLLSQVRASGVVIAGGTVDAFQSGSTTVRKTIWQDRDKAIEAANPYQLDANGTAHLFGDGLYRIVIKDASGVVKYDRDGLSFRDASGNVYDVADYASLAAAVASIGSTPATLQFATDVTVSANLVIPSTLELMPLNGAKINHTTYTISYAGSTARWPLAQIFNGTGLVSGLTHSKAIWFGASPTASAAVNTAAIQASINAVSSVGTWELGEGTHITDGEISFDSKSYLQIAFKGAIQNDTTSAVKFKDLNYCDITGITAFRSAYNWASGSGITLEGSFINSTLQFVRVSGFKYGLNLNASNATGISWNKFYLGEVRDNQYGVWVLESGSGWVNANDWYGGSLRLTASVKTAEAATDSWGMYWNSPAASVYQGNKFHGLKIEQLINGVYLSGAHSFWLDMRCEAVNNKYLVANTGSSLTIVNGSTVFEAEKYDIATSMRGVTVLGAATYSASAFKSTVYDNQYGGISFVNFSDPLNTATQLYSDYNNYQGTLRLVSGLNGAQQLDKQFTGSAAPTTGTFNQNAVVWNTNVTAGQTMGWVASRYGTMDTISTTGSMTIGTPTLTVASATGLKVGQVIAVAGAVTSGVIKSISGTTITLGVNATATVSGAAVTNYLALWKTMALYP